MENKKIEPKAGEKKPEIKKPEVKVEEIKNEVKVEEIKVEVKKTDYEFIAQIIIIFVLALLLTYNFGKINNTNITGFATGVGTVSASEIIPTGVPKVYGAEIGVKYDDISASNPSLTEATIAKLSSYEDLKLTDEQKKRYTKLGTSIACEYCCGAEGLVFSNGERACGCAHSFAMRGIAKYLLINHPDMSDDEILSEMGKWKVLFFPGIHEQKAAALKAQGIDATNYVNLASNKYRGIENGQPSGGAGAMVGGC